MQGSHATYELAPCWHPHLTFPPPPCRSPYVASRLQTYHEKGRVLLEMLLAKAGIPLKQAQLPFIREWGDAWGLARPPAGAQKVAGGCLRAHWQRVTHANRCAAAQREDLTLLALHLLRPSTSPFESLPCQPIPFSHRPFNPRRGHEASVPAGAAGQAGGAWPCLQDGGPHIQVLPAAGTLPAGAGEGSQLMELCSLGASQRR